MATVLKMNPSSADAWVNQTMLGETSVWELEKMLHVPNWVTWMDNTPMFSTYLVSAYLASLYFGQKFMRNKEAFELKQALVAWNVFLAVFSFVGALRTAPALMWTLMQENGVHNSICARASGDTVHTFWMLLFTLSKIIELGDTAFIVLKKKPLIFLHWFHHMTVLVYVWTTFTSFNSTGTIFMTMNFLIHTIMYTYYVLKLRGIRVPKSASIIVTFLQILQMVVGLSVNFYGLYAKSNGISCFVKTSHIYGCLAMYAAFLVLFADFFVKAYMTPRKKKIE